MKTPALTLALLAGPALAVGVIEAGLLGAVAAHAGPVTLALFAGTFIGWLTAVPATLMVMSIMSKRQGGQPDAPAPTPPIVAVAVAGTVISLSDNDVLVYVPHARLAAPALSRARQSEATR